MANHGPNQGGLQSGSPVPGIAEAGGGIHGGSIKSRASWVIAAVALTILSLRTVRR